MKHKTTRSQRPGAQGSAIVALAAVVALGLAGCTRAAGTHSTSEPAPPAVTGPVSTAAPTASVGQPVGVTASASSSAAAAAARSSLADALAAASAAASQQVSSLKSASAQPEGSTAP